MGNQKKQSAIAQDFSFIKLSLIDKSPFNPRKTFNEIELKELTDSIKEKGVIQPIVVRTVGERFEIVCGERRYRASLLAGLETIPSCIKNLSDDEAEEYAITENLQRKDVAPMEEAEAFARMIERKKYDVATLAVKFGKSEAYIRGRMRLVQLHPQFRDMLENEQINIGIANILAALTDELQADIYDKHFKESCQPYSSWTHYRPASLQSAIEEVYSTNLDMYKFDKEACNCCPFNTATFSLFSQNNTGKCTKRDCLTNKNNDYLYEKAINLQKENPELTFVKDISWNTNGEVIERLLESGNEVLRVNLIVDPSDDDNEEPIMPVRNDFDSNGEYEYAMNSYTEEKQEYDDELEERQERLKNGEIKAYIAIMANEVGISYAEVEEEENELINDVSDVANEIPEEQRNIIKTNPEILKLQSKINRNVELCNEKIIDAQKNVVRELEVTDEKLSSIEMALLYRFLIRDIDMKTFKKLGLKKEMYSIEYTDLLELSDKQVALIFRGYIMPKLTGLYLSCINAKQDNPLRIFLMQHAAEKVETVDSEWETIYEKRNDRLNERIEALQKEVEPSDMPQEDVEKQEEEEIAICEDAD